MNDEDAKDYFKFVFAIGAFILGAILIDSLKIHVAYSIRFGVYSTVVGLIVLYLYKKNHERMYLGVDAILAFMIGRALIVSKLKIYDIDLGLYIYYAIIGLIVFYWYNTSRTSINKVIPLMDAIKGEMSKELLEIHCHLLMNNGGNLKRGKLYDVCPRFKDFLIDHGIYYGLDCGNPVLNSINPSKRIFKKIKKELWIPIFYHEVAHDYWKWQNVVSPSIISGKEERYACMIGAEAWDLVRKHYQIKKEELKTELEQGLFEKYSRDLNAYNKYNKMNSEW